MASACSAALRVRRTAAASTTPNDSTSEEVADMTIVESSLHPETANFRHLIPAGEPYLFEVKAGQTLRLLDVEGNQAIDTLFFSAKNPRERFDPQRTLRRQNKVYLTAGTVLYSNLGN